MKRFFGICRELTNPEIELEVDEKNVCSCPGGRFLLQNERFGRGRISADSNAKGRQENHLSQEKFKGMLRKTSFAISTDESRYVLNGIFLSLKEHKMTMVATDGRRLALVDEEVDIPRSSQAELIIPPKRSMS